MTPAEITETVNTLFGQYVDRDSVRARTEQFILDLFATGQAAMPSGKVVSLHEPPSQAFP